MSRPGAGRLALSCRLSIVDNFIRSKNPCQALNSSALRPPDWEKKVQDPWTAGGGENAHVLYMRSDRTGNRKADTFRAAPRVMDSCSPYTGRQVPWKFQSVLYYFGYFKQGIFPVRGSYNLDRDRKRVLCQATGNGYTGKPECVDRTGE
jgi:hypothetical protein